MDMTPQEYKAYVKQKAKKSPILRDTALAFCIGGAICVLGQLIQNGWAAAGKARDAVVKPKPRQQRSEENERRRGRA